MTEAASCGRSALQLPGDNDVQSSPAPKSSGALKDVARRFIWKNELLGLHGILGGFGMGAARHRRRSRL